MGWSGRAPAPWGGAQTIKIDMQSWTDCIIGTHESSFWKRQAFRTVLDRHL